MRRLEEFKGFPRVKAVNSFRMVAISILATGLVWAEEKAKQEKKDEPTIFTRRPWKKPRTHPGSGCAGDFVR